MLNKPPLQLIKVWKNSFSSLFQLSTLVCRKVQRMIFCSPLTCLGEKSQYVWFQFPLHQKTISNFFINFSTSCEMVASCCEYLKFFTNFCTVWMSDKGWAEWANSSFRFLWKYWVAKSPWMVVNEPAERDAPYPLVIKSFTILFPLLDNIIRYTCWHVLCPSIVDIIKSKY